ncbi:Fe-S oxidoreductase [Thermogymnomonas acidicola]|uniref:Fe-S oxidoreductase n=1 Tax=Thermogymnomonas acidicola TaxID=399579 RepID=A0AA37BQ75_9ARCH|nr:(Fe-S)-binding protein [Thermogymnomonas acidicola]GGM68606.1 Fe-S oxidoreductase [Thermogymnomonas acidicola]
MVDLQSVMRQREAVRNVMFSYLMEQMVPFPFNREQMSSWASDIPRGGECIIYTSYMYQMAGLFRKYEEMLPRFVQLGARRYMVSLSRFFFRPEKEDVDRAFRILRNISGALRASGVQFGYLYEEEPYSGGLLLELGMLDEFREYGMKLASFFHSRGVKRIITVDPHTANALNRLRSLVGLEAEVIPYLKLIKPRISGRFAIHDSCLYSRHLGMREDIRAMMRTAGAEVVEDQIVTSRSGAVCCGAPLGPLSTDLSDSIARHRAESLGRLGTQVISFCPFCEGSLQRNGLQTRDFAEVI